MSRRGRPLGSKESDEIKAARKTVKAMGLVPIKPRGRWSPASVYTLLKPIIYDEDFSLLPESIGHRDKAAIRRFLAQVRDIIEQSKRNAQETAEPD
jgi:hypothetical protein